MPSIALIPSLAQGHPAGQFSSLPFQTSPEDWRPDYQSVRPPSYPSPYGRFEATSFLVGRDKFDQPLARASLALLKGLVGGALRFKWLAGSDLQSGRLQQLVNSTLPTQWPYVGLIDDEQGKTWGYSLETLLPVLAGARHGDIDELEERVRNRTKDGAIRRLLQPLRESFQARAAWAEGDIKKPWMRLIDRALEVTQEGPAVELDLRVDVRSFGPFRTGVDDEFIYLPSASRGFVANLAQAIVRGDPVQPQGSPFLDVVLGGDTRVSLVHRPSAAVLDGVVVGSPPPSAPTQSSVALPGSNVIQQMGTHVGRASNKRPPEEAPWDFSDIQRAVAVYAPELLGRAKRPFVSEALRSKAVVFDRTEADLLCKQGHAFLLPLDEDGDSSALFVERGRDKEGLCGDLSMLGLALWHGFIGDDFDSDGKPYLVKHDQQFPVRFHPSLEAWWRDATKMTEVKKKLATLQRFLAAYLRPGAQTDWAGLASSAVWHFVRRLFGSDSSIAVQLDASARGIVIENPQPSFSPDLGRARDLMRVRPGGH